MDEILGLHLDVSGPSLARLDPDDVRGRHLRFCLLTVMGDGGGAWSIAELCERLSSLGLTVGGGDPAKTVADVLRYECAKGRAVRVARGRYRALPRPDTTTRRHRERLLALRALRARRHPDSS